MEDLPTVRQIQKLNWFVDIKMNIGSMCFALELKILYAVNIVD